MNIKNQLKLTLLILGFLAIQPNRASAQESDDFIKKLRYLEKTEIRFWLASGNTKNCLTAGELSQFVPSGSMSEVVETIDYEGDLLTTRNIVYDNNVRDDWMGGYGSIKIEKDHVEITNLDGEIMAWEERQPEATFFLSPEEAQHYMRYDLDGEFLHQLGASLQHEGHELLETDNMLQSKTKSMALTYDRNIKVITAVQYDSMGMKKSESALEFKPQADGYYFPWKETEINWSTTDSGCCVKKVKELTRFDVRRHSATEYESMQPNNHDHTDESGFEIKVQKDLSSFTVNSKRFRLKPVEVAVYDLTGKQLLITKVKPGKPIPLPSEIRTGMYLVHIISANRHAPVVGKIIKIRSGSSL